VPRTDTTGLFRYRDWLPVPDAAADAGVAVDSQVGTVAYRARDLGASLGLDRLVVLFNGFWPERGARLAACSFKELEARSVLARAASASGTLVVASAGNTGRAFHQVCSESGVPGIIVVPARALPYLWGVGHRSAAVRLVAVTGDADYYDAIQVADVIAQLPGNLGEGGARNVARRDGMGASFLAGLELSDELPDHYFQAVGSGTGAIAAWEMASRAVADGRFGPRVPQLHLAQNDPFTIMTDAWRARSRQLPRLSSPEAKRQIDTIKAHVLSNRQPPYGITGGLFDALSASRGQMYGVTNREAEDAAHLFRTVEGCDLDPAAAVALASMQHAIAAGSIRRGELVFLNVTGGGYKHLREHMAVEPLQADIEIDAGWLGTADPASLIEDAMDGVRTRSRQETA
jgi:cysteate synthase